MENSEYNALLKYLSTYVDMARLHGILCAQWDKENKQSNFHVPFAIKPYQVSQEKYEQLRQVQPIIAKFLIRLADDKDRCNKLLSETAKTDNFVENLLNIYNKTFEDNPQKNTFHVIRSDYMLDQQKNNFLMVQYNTIAVSFGPISERVQKVIKTLNSLYFSNEYKKQNFPECNNTELIGGSMAKAIKNANLNGVVAIVVSQNECNKYDQRATQFELAHHGINSIRVTLKQLAAGIKLDEQNRNIYYEGKQIAAFYFRDGYDPKSYPDQSIWTLRQTIERSKAIKVPTIALQLVNFKKVQQQMSRAELLLEYLSQEESNALLAVTAKMWNFENQAEQDSIIELASSHKYVLKPNRQGGMHNFYGEKVHQTLVKLSPQERKAYVLMERIYPKAQVNYFVRRAKLTEESTISELSVISVISTENGTITQNEVGGHLIRTKNEKSDEGGVAVGFSVINSLYFK